MSEMIKFLKRLTEHIKAGRRTPRGGDPGKGIEYNKFSIHYMVSRYIYSIDIARTPQIVRNDFQRVDVHKQGWKANPMRSMVDYHASKVKGRGR